METQSPKNDRFGSMLSRFVSIFSESQSPKNDTFGGVLGNWFSNKVKYSYIWLRTVEKTIVSFMASLCMSNPIIPFIGGPFIIGIVLFITSIWFIPSMISVFVNENPNDKFGIWISILGLFFGWTWAVPMFTSFVQIFTSMFKFILLPLMMNSSDIFKIMGKDWNAFWLMVIYVIFISISALENTDLSFSVPFSISWIIILLLFWRHIAPKPEDNKK